MSDILKRIGSAIRSFISDKSRSEKYVKNEKYVKWGNFFEDRYESEAEFSENTDYELATIFLKGSKHSLNFKFSFSHCYQIMDRRIFSIFCQTSHLNKLDKDYPIYRIENSSLIEYIIHSSGGLLEKNELEHYRVVSSNLIFDIILCQGEEIQVNIEEVEDSELGEYRK